MTPEDWSDLTDAQVLERMAEALGECLEARDDGRCNEGIPGFDYERLGRAEENAHRALAAYRAREEALTADALRAGLLTAEAMPEEDEIEVCMLDACNALEAIRGVLPCIPQNAAYRAIDGAAEVGRKRAIEALDAYRLHKEPRS